MTRHYLDHAATTPMRPGALTALVEAAGLANPSSLHTAGRRARRAVEDSRDVVAALLEVPPSRVIFTSGATEADNIAITGLFRARRRQDPGRVRVLVPAVEHKAVLDTCAALADLGAAVQHVPVDGGGVLQPTAVAAAIREQPRTVALVAAMAANNETGVLNPVADLAEVCRAADVPLHCDAAQAVGWRSAAAATADTAAISGHKLGGPMGVGALVVPERLDLGPHTHGGGQEAGIRSGTVPAAAVVALAAALAEAAQQADAQSRRVGALREHLESALARLVPEAVVSGAGAARLPNICHVWLPGCPADTMLMLLDAAGLDVSTGSACTAGIPQPSHVVLAMGGSTRRARQSLRFSLGWTSTSADVEALLAALPDAVARARAAAGERA